MATVAASKFYAVIAGVGAGTGRSLAIKFSKTYPVALLSRKPENYEPIVDEINKAGGQAIGISTDTSDEENVKKTFATIKEKFGDKQLVAAVYNVGGSFIRKPFLELSTQDFKSGYESNAVGLFHFGQFAIPLLHASVSSNPPYPPSLIVTGATASTKSSAQCASFAVGKHALRALTASIAREYGPKGVHVAHVIVDAVINIPRTAHIMANAGEDAKSDPDSLAETYWNLHTQHRSGFTFELDVRPFVEKW